MPVKKPSTRRSVAPSRSRVKQESAVLKRIYGENEGGLQEFTRPTSRAWLGWIGALCAVLLAGQWWFHRLMVVSAISDPPAPVVEVRFSPESAKPGELVRVELTARALATSTAERLEWLMPPEFHPATSTEWRSLALPALQAGGEWKWSGEGIFAATDATSSAFTLVRLKGGEAASRKIYVLPSEKSEWLHIRLATSTRENAIVTGSVQWQAPQSIAKNLQLRTTTRGADGNWYDDSSAASDASDLRTPVPASGSSTVVLWPKRDDDTMSGELEVMMGGLYDGEFVPFAMQRLTIPFAKSLLEWFTSSVNAGHGLFIGGASGEPILLTQRLQADPVSGVKIEQLEWVLRPVDATSTKSGFLLGATAPFGLTTSTKLGIMTIRSEPLTKHPLFKDVVKEMDWNLSLMVRGHASEAIGFRVEQKAVIKDATGKKRTVFGPPVTINIVSRRITR